MPGRRPWLDAERADGWFRGPLLPFPAEFVVSSQVPIARWSQRIHSELALNISEHPTRRTTPVDQRTHSVSSIGDTDRSLPGRPDASPRSYVPIQVGSRSTMLRTFPSTYHMR